ncbi:MAG TPA: DUF1223 domain-containing protein [Myxococcales bacterium]|nr:DUF1223 domain-containing protein [Myxococcales bacterium]
MSRMLAAVLILAALPARAVDRVPVLVELFTSEGCSSCPPADALLARLLRDQPVQGVEIVALSEHVDYWDSLGWKDPYSSPVFTERQQDYSSRLRRGGIYTPQAVVDGRAELIGSDEAAARSAAAAAAAQPHGTLTARRTGNALHLEAKLPPHSGAEILLASVDDPPPARVARGENAGRTLTHVRVVRELRSIGRAEQPSWSGDVQLDAGAARLRLVVFVQERSSGRVLAVASQSPP